MLVPMLIVGVGVLYLVFQVIPLSTKLPASKDVLQSPESAGTFHLRILHFDNDDDVGMRLGACKICLALFGIHTYIFIKYI